MEYGFNNYLKKLEIVDIRIFNSICKNQLEFP